MYGLMVMEDGEHCKNCGAKLEHHLSRGNGRKKTCCNFDCLATRIKLKKKLQFLIKGRQETVDQNMYFVKYIYKRLEEGILPKHLYDLTFRLHMIGLLRPMEEMEKQIIKVKDIQTNTVRV